MDYLAVLFNHKKPLSLKVIMVKPLLEVLKATRFEGAVFTNEKYLINIVKSIF